MKILKKVILTFAIFLACFGVAKIYAYSSAVVTGIETFTDTTGKDKTKINGMVLDLDKGTYVIGINVNATENPKAAFSIKGKPFIVNNPVDKSLFTFTTNIKEGLNSPAFQTSAFVEKQDQTTIPEIKEPITPVSGEQECYISYKYKFFCPENPSTSQIAQKTERRGLDIVFVIDRSETVSSIISNMKTAVLGILGKLDSNIDRVGIVSFGNYGTRLFELGNNFSAARTIINNWKAGDKSTNIADGLKKAGEMFDSGSEGENRKIMILVSDGIANSSTSGECPDNQSYPVTQNKCTNDALAQGRAVRSKGISLYTIGYNFAKTNAIKANAGSFAKSLMINVAGSSANFSESSDLANLLSHFDSIVKRSTFYIKKTIGACQNVTIRFNHNGKYEFAPAYSDAYKGTDGTGISWNLGDVDKKGEGANFVIKGIFRRSSGNDINSIGQGIGFGDFEISYKDSKGVIKEIGYSHKDILENMVEYPIIENPVAGKIFLAAFSTNCNKDNLETIKKPVIPTQPEEPVIPTTPTTPTDAVEKEQMITLSREITPLDCEKVGVKLTLRCNGSETENKCRWSEFQQYSQNGQYVSGSLKVSDTKKASCKADITGTVSCTTGLLASGDSITIDFQLLARKKVDTQGNKLPISNPVVFFDENEGKNRSSSNYLIYHKNDAGDIDYIKINGGYSAQVQDCGQTIANNGELAVSRDVYPSQNCQEAKIKITIDCQNKNGCGMIAINEQLSATFGYDAVKIGRFNITAPSSLIVSASVVDQRNFSFPLSRSLNYQEKIIIEYSAKTSSSALTQTPNTSDSHIAYNGKRINIPVKQTTINQCVSNSEYNIQRTVEPIDCQMAKVNLRIKCNAKQGSGAYCSPVFIYDYLPQGAKHYHKNDSPRLSESGCSAHILPTGAFAGSNIFCHVRYQEMKDGDIKDLVYYIEFDENHTGLQSTTDVSRVSFMQSGRPVYMPDTKVDVKKCKSKLLVNIENIKEKCQELLVKGSLECVGDKGCDNILYQDIFPYGTRVENLSGEFLRSTITSNSGFIKNLPANEKRMFSYKLFLNRGGVYNQNITVFLNNQKIDSISGVENNISILSCEQSSMKTDLKVTPSGCQKAHVRFEIACSGTTNSGSSCDGFIGKHILSNGIKLIEGSLKSNDNKNYCKQDNIQNGIICNIPQGELKPNQLIIYEYDINFDSRLSGIMTDIFDHNQIVNQLVKTDGKRSEIPLLKNGDIARTQVQPCDCFVNISHNVPVDPFSYQGKNGRVWISNLSGSLFFDNTFAKEAAEYSCRAQNGWYYENYGYGFIGQQQINDLNSYCGQKGCPTDIMTIIVGNGAKVSINRGGKNYQLTPGIHFFNNLFYSERSKFYGDYFKAFANSDSVKTLCAKDLYPLGYRYYYELKDNTSPVPWGSMSVSCIPGKGSKQTIEEPTNPEKPSDTFIVKPFIANLLCIPDPEGSLITKDIMLISDHPDSIIESQRNNFISDLVIFSRTDILNRNKNIYNDRMGVMFVRDKNHNLTRLSYDSNVIENAIKNSYTANQKNGLRNLTGAVKEALLYFDQNKRQQTNYHSNHVVLITTGPINMNEIGTGNCADSSCFNEYSELKKTIEYYQKKGLIFHFISYDHSDANISNLISDNRFTPAVSLVKEQNPEYYLGNEFLRDLDIIASNIYRAGVPKYSGRCSNVDVEVALDPDVINIEGPIYIDNPEPIILKDSFGRPSIMRWKFSNPSQQLFTRYPINFYIKSKVEKGTVYKYIKTLKYTDGVGRTFNVQLPD
ncbi:MAG TPA: vWA domain-containing protein [Candidatus Pacearchaeota archaeon]|nr:vWA domain-containing protein [Candidatus Pacearchaeota archaeon]